MECLHRTGIVEEVRKESFSKEQDIHYLEVISSPIGPLTLTASESALISLDWGSRPTALNETSRSNHPILKAAVAQLKEYFSGKRKNFDLPLAPKGTDFQKRVWQELLKIPYGECITYGEQAKRLGNPMASRAVGGANGKNPIGIIIPCHRVVGSSGRLTGFTGGLDIKAQLLAIEGVRVRGTAALV